MTRTARLGRLTRFAGVGVVNTAIDLGAYTGLALLGVPSVLANLVSTTLGMSFSFLANRSFTFRAAGGGRRSATRQLVLFLAVNAVGLWAVQPAVILFATWVFAAVGLPTAGLWVAVPKALAIGVALCWNYLWYAGLVFRDRPGPRAEERAGEPAERRKLF